METSPISAKQNKRNISGSIKAQAAGVLPSLAIMPINLVLIEKMSKLNNSLTKDQVELVNNGAKKALSEITNLGAKGVKIANAANENEIFLLSDLFPSLKKLPKTILNIISPTDAAANGKNAFFAGATNQVLVNKEKFSLTTFHELGHAFNFNNTNFWKSMQKARNPLMAIASLIAVIPALTKEAKAKDGEELTKKQKINNFIRNIAPVASGAAMLGIAAEEAMATTRGNQWAKQLLEPSLAKKVAKSNAYGFISYVLVALATGVSSYVCKKVKDSSDEKRALKSQQNIS